MTSHIWRKNVSGTENFSGTLLMVRMTTVLMRTKESKTWIPDTSSTSSVQSAMKIWSPKDFASRRNGTASRMTGIQIQRTSNGLRFKTRARKSTQMISTLLVWGKSTLMKSKAPSKHALRTPSLTKTMIRWMLSREASWIHLLEGAGLCVMNYQLSTNINIA